MVKNSTNAEIDVLVDSCVFIDAFDPASVNHTESLSLLVLLSEKGIAVTMPAHGWFEVQCSLQKLRRDGRFVGPTIDSAMQYPLKLLHIDDKFIRKYSMADIPYVKAGDHIFLAVARVNRVSLITSDHKLLDAARVAGVSAFAPGEALAEIQSSGKS